jgi:hypothetical protein
MVLSQTTSIDMDEVGPAGHEAERVDGHWLVIAYPDNPTIRLDARLLDRVFANDTELVLAVGDVTVGAVISGGPNAARELAEKLAPYTRSATINSREVYEEAKRRLRVARGLSRDPAPPALFVGDDPVRASPNVLYIGDFKCRISDVDRYSKHALTLPLPKGRIPAALAMLYVAAKRRSEDPELLARRIQEYEDHLASDNASTSMSE